METEKTLVENEQQINDEVQDQQINETDQKVKEILDWTKDDKFEKVWKKDPNNLYKSYNESQKQWHEFYNQLSKVLKEYKIKNADELKGYFDTRKDYDDLRKNEENFMNLWNHPDHGQKLQKLFNEIANETKQLESDPTYQSQKRLEMLESKLASYEEKEKMREGQIKLDSYLNEVNSLSKKYGIKSFKESEFIEELRDNSIPFEGIKSYFIEKFLPDIIKGEKSKVESSVVNNLKNNSKGSILSDSKAQNKKTELSWDEAINGLLNK